MTLRPTHVVLSKTRSPNHKCLHAISSENHKMDKSRARFFQGEIMNYCQKNPVPNTNGHLDSCFCVNIV